MYRIPCVHACVAIQFVGRSIYNFCLHYFASDMYRLSYEQSIFPITSIDIPKVDISKVEIKPWKMKVHSDRPKRKRIPSEFKELIMCGRCRKHGYHNRKTCTKLIEDWTCTMSIEIWTKSIETCVSYIWSPPYFPLHFFQ